MLLYATFPVTCLAIVSTLSKDWELFRNSEFLLAAQVAGVTLKMRCSVAAIFVQRDSTSCNFPAKSVFSKD